MLTPKEMLEAGVGDDSVFTEAARRKLKEDIRQLASERLRLEREVRSYLPAKFVMIYQSLCDMAWGTGKDYRADPDRMDGVTDGTRGFGPSDGGLRDQAAADYRRIVDRKIRQLAREMGQWVGGDGASRLAMAIPVRCPRCSKFCANEWGYCPWCGTQCSAAR